MEDEQEFIDIAAPVKQELMQMIKIVTLVQLGIYVNMQLLVLIHKI